MKLIIVCVLYYFQKWHTTQAIQGLPLFDHWPPLQVCIQAKVKEGIAGGLINNSDSACWILSKPTLCGVQIYCCCKGDYGHICQMQAYTGAGLSGSEKNHGENVVKRLTQDFWTWATSLIGTASAAA